MYKDNNNDPEKENNIEAGKDEKSESDIAQSGSDINTDADDKASVTDAGSGEEIAAEDEKKEETPDGVKGKSSKKKTAFFKKRSFKFGSMATAFAAIFILIVILINVVLSVVSQKHTLSVDLTNAKSYELSSETLSFLKKINKPITIKMFATKTQMESVDKQYLDGAIKLIQQYPKQNGEISIQYIDYDKNPTAAAAYENADVTQYDVIVSTKNSSGKEVYKKIDVSDLVVTETNSSTYQQTVVGNKAEEEIDSALDYVTTTVHPAIIFTTGHDEQDATYYQSLLKTSNYNISQVNTATKSISESASAIVITDPQSDFSASEITKIDKFLKNGGKYGKSIFIYLDPRVQSLPNLEEYISEWGVKVGKGAIYDTTNCFNNAYDPVASDVDSDTTGISSSTNMQTDVRLSKPLSVIFDSKGSRTVKSVIKTGDTSQLLSNISGSASDSDKKGPFTAMTLSTWASDSGSSKSNMLVSGSFEILDQDLINATNKNNKNVLLGIANNLMGKQSSISVTSKYSASTQLSLTTSQRYAVLTILVIIIPIAVLAIGLIQWLRRRHL